MHDQYAALPCYVPWEISKATCRPVAYRVFWVVNSNVSWQRIMLGSSHGCSCAIVAEHDSSKLLMTKYLGLPFAALLGTCAGTCQKLLQDTTCYKCTCIIKGPSGLITTSTQYRPKRTRNALGIKWCPSLSCSGAHSSIFEYRYGRSLIPSHMFRDSHWARS